MNSDIVTQIWYDSDKLEMLSIIQTKQQHPQPDNEQPEIIFTDVAEDGKKMSEHHPWAKYRTQWEFTKKDLQFKVICL